MCKIVGDRPLHPFAIRFQLREISQSINVSEINPKEWGALVGCLNLYFGKDNLRRIVLWWLFGDLDISIPKSSKELTIGEKYAIKLWIDMKLVDDNNWAPNYYFVQESVDVVKEAAKSWHGDIIKAEPIEYVKEALSLGGIITDITEMERTDITCLI
jgi:hypothetical protein